MRILAGLVVASACNVALASAPVPRALTFEERVHAQDAIERVYYGHQVGATKPFETAVPRAGLEAKVRKYLEQTAALNANWKTAVTDDMLQHELERMATGSRMPERLIELYAALGNDPFLIKECIARATLVDRLARDFNDDASDAILRTAVSRLQGDLIPSVAKDSTPVPLPAAACARADTWTPISLAGAPSPRRDHTAVWTGSLMLIWGGIDPDHDVLLTNGARYDPATDSWTPISAVDAPSPRFRHSAVWTGSAMLVWGGRFDDDMGTIHFLNSGGIYDPASDSWTPTSTEGAPAGRYAHLAVWTGSRMIVWGGAGSANQSGLSSGSLYDPATGIWTPMTTTGAPPSGASAVWTGSLMLVWQTRTGARYDPATDSWTPISTTGGPFGTTAVTTAWTGTSMIVWGADVANGRRYDPTTDSWTPVSTVGARTRYRHTAVWTGNVMLVWGGEWIQGVFQSGESYNPLDDSWTSMSMTDAPDARYWHTAVWTGSSMLVWGGYGYFNGGGGFGFLDTGGSYAVVDAIDTDADGVCDANDQCSATSLTPTVEIEGCETGVANHAFPTGCNFGDQIAACDAATNNHGQFLRCVTSLIDGWQGAGLITRKGRSRIFRCAAQGS